METETGKVSELEDLNNQDENSRSDSRVCKRMVQIPVLPFSVQSARAQRIGVTTIRRAELTDSETSMTAANDLAVRRALETAGVEFIDENGGGPGVRLRKRLRPKLQPIEI
jgi:hypothetical protein